MSKIFAIFTIIIFNFLFKFAKSNPFLVKNLLFPVDFKETEEYVLRGSQDYIKVSVVNDLNAPRNTFPICLAVGCTKTALICERKNGKMITSFRSVNDTRQAYFRSTLVMENMILSVNCRESHTACCFEDPKKLQAVAAPAASPKPTIISAPLLSSVPSVAQKPSNIMPAPANPPMIQSGVPALQPDAIKTTLPLPQVSANPIPEWSNPEIALSKAPGPTKVALTSLPTFVKTIKSTIPSLQPTNPLAKTPQQSPIVLHLVEPVLPQFVSTIPIVNRHPITTPTPPTTNRPESTTSEKPLRPVKIYLFSNLCLGFLGGAGFVDCNG